MIIHKVIAVLLFNSSSVFLFIKELQCVFVHQEQQCGIILQEQ